MYIGMYQNIVVAAIIKACYQTEDTFYDCDSVIYQPQEAAGERLLRRLQNSPLGGCKPVF